METSMTDPWPLALLPFTKKCRPACGYAFAVSLSSLGLAAILVCPIYVYGAKSFLGRAEQIQKGPG